MANRMLKSATFIVVGVGAALCDLRADVITITQGSTTGYTMTDGNTYVIEKSVVFSNSTAGGSGMTVASGATVVLYVPTNITLTATGSSGGAGIRLPQSSTLVR